MKKYYSCLITFFVSLTFCMNIHAQDEEMLTLLTDTVPADAPVSATFKSSRIINAHTVETVRKNNLDFRVAHRFGNIGKKGGGGFHTLYGFDASTDINIALEYGISDRFTAGLSRSKFAEAWQGSLKYRLIRQTESDRIPLSVTVFANTLATAAKAADSRFDNTAHRFSYCYQAIIARKFTPGFSLELLPTVLHRNFVPDINDENTNFALGIGGRLKLSRRSAIIADYFYTFSDFRQANSAIYFMPLSVGWEVETGGHVFTLMFSNATALVENDFLVNTTDSWRKGGYKFSFIISRNFVMGNNPRRR